MPLLDQLQKDIVAAMKAREEARLSALRMIKSALQKAHVDAAKPMDDAADQQLLKSLMKQRTDAAEMFRKGGRDDMADKEEAERKIIESYLPAAASEEDMQGAVEAAMAEIGAAFSNQMGAKQMGAVMKVAQAKLAGKTVDGKLLSEKVKARLA